VAAGVALISKRIKRTPDAVRRGCLSAEWRHASRLRDEPGPTATCLVDYGPTTESSRLEISVLDEFQSAGGRAKRGREKQKRANIDKAFGLVRHNLSLFGVVGSDRTTWVRQVWTFWWGEGSSASARPL
jgi:hypothetical protein